MRPIGSGSGLPCWHHRLPLALVAALLLPLLLAPLAGCGGVPRGPLLAENSPTVTDLTPEPARRARAESLVRLGQTALQTGDSGSAGSLFEQAALTDPASL